MKDRILRWVRNTVIVILVLIVAAVVLFPIFGRAGGDDRKSYCTNSMKQLGAALEMYCKDNGNMLPSSYLVSRSREWNAKDFTTFASAKGSSTGSKSATWASLLHRYMKNEDIIWCPSDLNKSNDHNARTSYYYKAAIDRAWYGDKNGRYQRLDDFDHAADQVVFWERSSFHWKDYDLPLRNGDSLHVTYLDGHVVTKRITNCGYSADENPPGPLPRSGKGEPAWFNAGTKDGNPQTGQFWDPRIYCDLLD